MPRLASCIVAGAFFLLVSRAPGRAMTVGEAYQETQQRHASVDPTSAGFSREEGSYLSHVFEIVDLAIVEKTQARAWFQSGARRGEPVREYRARVDSLVAILNRLPTPARLIDVRRLLIEAIRDQESFFETWDESLTVTASARGNREVLRTRGMYMKASSRKLHEVYGLLMSLFPEAGQQNFDAFHDHLSVLALP
jgi:hypothetical protein